MIHKLLMLLSHEQWEEKNGQIMHSEPQQMSLMDSTAIVKPRIMHNKKKVNMLVHKIALLIVIVFIGLLVFQGISDANLADKQQYFFKSVPKPEGGKELPRILWVQTDYELEAMQMEAAMAAQNLIHFGREGGFEVRIVNNLNAYDWLSEDMIALIKDIRHKAKAELPVYELLRLALLYEHGGVSIRLPNILLLEGLGWVEDLMRGSYREQMGNKTLSCQLPRTDAIVFHQEKPDGHWYKDQFISAKPKAGLLAVLINATTRIAREGAWPYPKYPIAKFDQDTLVASFPGMTEVLINIISRESADLCSAFGVQSFHVENSEFMVTALGSRASATIKLSETAFRHRYGRRRLLRIALSQIEGDIIHAIKTGDLSAGGGESLLKTKLFMAEGNRWLATPSPKTREVRLCVVSLTPARAAEAEQSVRTQLARLSKQSFAAWSLVAFVEGLPSASRPLGDSAVLVNASQYEGLNLQRAATKYCDPASVMLLLDLDETLATDSDLETLANHFKPIGVYAAFFKLKIGEEVLQASDAVRKEVMRKVNKPNAAVLSDIGNLLRAFTVSAYRFISHIDMRQSLHGRYFDREIPLLSMLQFGESHSACDWGNLNYQNRRLQRYMALLQQRVFINVTLNTNRFKTADLTRHQYFAKFRYYKLCEIIFQFYALRAPIELIAVFNDGHEEEGLQARRGLPELIPRKIHQVWVGGQIPAFKQFLMKRMRDIHPTYEYFLWTEQNITRENFPESYDLLQTLVEFDKKSPYSKMAAVADIMRNEIVYRHGGFYFDTNYMLFGESPLDQFLSYSLMDAGGMPLRQRVFRDNAVFGAMKKHPNLAQIVSHRALSSRNQYSWHIVQETGPGLFGRIQRGKEELDPTIFQQTLEEFYPNYHGDAPSNNINKCLTPNTTPDSEVLFRSPKHSYLKNCSAYYSYAFGIDFTLEGGSYINRRW